MSEKPPTASQMAKAADTLLRFRRSRDLTPEEDTAVSTAAHLIGMASWAKVAADRKVTT